MKAAYLIAPERYEVREKAIPVCPQDGLVLKVEVCGICGSDLRRWKEGQPSKASEVVNGHEIAGVVTQVGSDVNKFKVGDRLAIAPDIHCGNCYYCRMGLYNLCENLRLIGITPGYDGGFAEYLLITAEIIVGGILNHIPPSLNPFQAAFAEPLSSVLAAHNEAGISPGNVVVILGGGPMGCIHLVMAKVNGANVILSEPNKDRRKLAARFGPMKIIDPTTQDLIDETRQMTEGLGADIAICANSVAETHTQAVELVRKRGKVVLFGGLPKDRPMSILNGNRVHYSEIKVLGTFSYHPHFHHMALNTIQKGVINPDEFITHTYPIEKVNEAFQKASSGKALKVMIGMHAFS